MFVLVATFAKAFEVLGCVRQGECGAVDADKSSSLVEGVGVFGGCGQPSDGVASQPPEGSPSDALSCLVDGLIADVGEWRIAGLGE